MKAIIDIPDDVNQTLAIMKAQMGFKNKSETITYVVKRFREENLEPEVRPEYVKKILASESEKGIPFKNMDELRKRYV